MSTERLQAFLDDELAPGERARVEEHVGECTRCAAELEVWRSLFDDLEAMERQAPREGFGDRVWESVDMRGPRLGASGVLARLRGAIAGLRPYPAPTHPTVEVLQELLDGTLSSRLGSKLQTHLDECATCTREMAAWRGMYARLGDLEALAPGEGFADRVMAAVKLPEPYAAAAHSARLRGLIPSWQRVLSVARRFAPRTRRAWAVVSGAAVAPAATISLMMYAVFSHPNVTPQALVSFAMWQLGELFRAGSVGLLAAASEMARTSGVDSVARFLMDAPFAVAAGVAAYSVLSALALRVLYTNLRTRPRHAVTSS